MAKRLLDAGFPAADVQVIGLPDSEESQISWRVAEYGNAKADPVARAYRRRRSEARRLVRGSVFPSSKRTGFFYGRGTLDVKDGAAILVATLARLNRKAIAPTAT